MLLHPASHPQLVHFFCPVASTPRRVLRHLCTCIARPLCIDSAKSCRVSCFARQLRVSCRAVAVSSITSISFTLCAVRHALVHLECYLALLSHQPPKASTTALSLVLSPLEHCLEQCRTPTLSTTDIRVEISSQSALLRCTPSLKPSALITYLITRSSNVQKSFPLPRAPLAADSIPQHFAQLPNCVSVTLAADRCGKRAADDTLADATYGTFLLVSHNPPCPLWCTDESFEHACGLRHHVLGFISLRSYFSS